MLSIASKEIARHQKIMKRTISYLILTEKGEDGGGGGVLTLSVLQVYCQCIHRQELLSFFYEFFSWDAICLKLHFLCRRVVDTVVSLLDKCQAL